MAFNESAIPGADTLSTLAALEVFDEEGQKVKVGDLYKDQSLKTAVIWIRHFNCGICQDYLLALAEHVKPETLLSAGAKVCIIGCGEWKHIKPYKELISCPFPIYADPSRSTYKTLGMIENLKGSGQRPTYLKRGVISNAVVSMKNAFKIGGILGGGGHIAQNGGELVLRGNECFFAHRMPNTTGHTEVPELMKVLGVE